MPNQELKARIVVAVSDNENIHNDSFRKYHLSIKVSDSLIERLLPLLIVLSGESSYRDALGRDGYKLMQDLFDTGVVREMYFYTHSVQVFRAINLYKLEWISWNEVNTSVLSVLKQRFPRPGEVEVLEVNAKDITRDHYHPNDSDQPGFQMPA